MESYAIIIDVFLLIAFLLDIILSLILILKGERTETTLLFAVFCFWVGFWTLGIALFRISKNLNQAYFWNQEFIFTAGLIASTFVHFTFAFTKRHLSFTKKILVHLPNLFILIGVLIPGPLIQKIIIRDWGKESVLGYAYVLYGIYFTIYILYGFYKLYISYREEVGINKLRLKYILFGVGVAYIVGAYFNLYLILLGNYRYIWIGPYCSFILVSITTYSILRYHLLEIEIVFRKTIVFTGVFTFVFGAFVGTAYLAQTFWAQITGSELLAMAIAVLIIVLVQEPLKNMLIKYTDRFFLQKKYDYQKVLRDASEGMSTVRESKWLLGLITHIVSSKMRVSNIGIFLEEDQMTTEHYFLKAKRGKETIQHTSLSKDNPICLWLKDNKKPLVLEEIDYLLQRKDSSTDDSSLKNMLTRIKSQMQSLNSKVIIPAFYKGSLLGFLSLGYKLSGDMYTKEDLILLSTLSNSAAVAIENARLFDNLIDEIEINNQLRKEEEDSYMQMMMSLAKTIDAKDSYTYDHVEMVYQYGIDLAEYLPGVNRDALKASLRLHDLGKIGVPDSILSKQGPLTPEEWKKIKDHTILGARILAPLKRFEYVAKIILHHQEKFDGTGYPAGLKEEDIPLESRIIAVVDAFHAMVSDRPYRKALSKQIAIAELRKFAGTQFDPIVVEAFLKLLEVKYGITET